MMFITPMPPSASVTRPTTREELLHVVDDAVEEQRLHRRVPHRERFAILGVEALAPREDAADLALERPVDVGDAAGAAVEHGRQLVDHRRWRGATMSCDSVPGSAHPGAGRSRAITANGMKILLLSGPL